jgi:hypothetical protein
MNKEPLISFYIPVYKKPADVFRNCLKSLFNQSLKEIEVICVFDGPDEELQDVAKEFPKVRSAVIEHGGAPKARNKGLEMATGKYVSAWDADCRAKPEMAQRWVDEFKALPDVDFVYTGYELAEGLGTFDSESFDVYSLQSGNYISSMSPIKREKALRWDETLEAGQDWDYWLTAVENGCKGVWIEGHGFITDTPRSGISSDKWSASKRDETISTIRRKHGIDDRPIGVYSQSYHQRAVHLAKILNADVIKLTGHTPTTYKVIFNLGYGLMSRFEGIPSETIKIQYWLPGEIAGLAEAKYNVVMETIRVAKGVINYCNTDYEKNKLGELGITAEVLPLPISHEDMSKVSHELPKDFSILVATDEAYAKLFKELSIDLPHIKFSFNSGRVDDFSCLMYFYQFATVDNAVLVAHVNGRNVISNIQAPFCGFVDPDQSWELFKKELFESIRKAMSLPFNKEAQDYYLSLASPDNFKSQIGAHLKPELEVV